jgi:hypothetical protein
VWSTSDALLENALSLSGSATHKTGGSSEFPPHVGIAKPNHMTSRSTKNTICTQNPHLNDIHDLGNMYATFQQLPNFPSRQQQISVPPLALTKTVGHRRRLPSPQHLPKTFGEGRKTFFGD